MKAWILASVVVSAPGNDLQLLKLLLEYSSVNDEVSKTDSQRFSNHLWYLAPDIMGLVLFDSQVSASSKRLTVRSMKEGNEKAAHGHMK